jgi:phasin family protein
MTDSDQNKPVIAKPAKAVSTRKPAAAVKPAAKPVAAKTPVAKAPAPVAKAPAPVAKVAPPKIVKPVAAKAPVPQAAAPKPVAPKVEPVKAPAPALIENSPAPIAPQAETAVAAPLVEVVVAAVAETPVSKPVEAPVSSFIAPKASTIPPIPQFKVSFMSTQSFKGYEDFAAFGKANLEAFVQANTLFAKGIESLSKEVVSLAQSSLESSTAATKAIFAAKTLKDVVELQADFAKTSFEKLVANSTKLGEMTVKLATDSTAPIGARVTAASEKALKPVA